MKIKNLVICFLCFALTVPAFADLEVARVVGETLPLSVKHDGTLPCQYQWKKNGVAIPGATTKDYSFVVTASSAGAYSVDVSNPAGKVTSDAARLTVIIPPTTATVEVPQSSTR